MARQTKTVELVTGAGQVATYAAAHADGHSATWHKDLLLHVKQGAGARVVTIPVAQTFEGRVITSRTVNVGANTEVFIGPFSAAYQQADGGLWVDFDGTSNTTFAAIRLGVG